MITPGPYKWVRTRDSSIPKSPWYLTLVSERKANECPHFDQTIIPVRRDWAQWAHSGTSDNERLLAASWDLLESLTHLLRCFELNMDDTKEDTIAACEKARAAIEKATGREEKVIKALS